MDRRSFFRVAVLGGAAGAAIEACPEFVEDLLTRKSYFFMGGRNDEIIAILKKMYAEAAEHMAETLATDMYLSGLTVKAPGYVKIGKPGYPFGYLAKQYKASVAMPSDPKKWLVDLT